MSQENKPSRLGVAGCGGGCACAAKQNSSSGDKRQTIQAAQADVFSSVALASELLCQPGDDYVDNIRSLWSSLAPCEQVFASGAKQWPPVDAMLSQWFESNAANVTAAQVRFDQAFPLPVKDNNAAPEAIASLRHKVETISELLFKIAPLYARENYFVSRGNAPQAEACAQERLGLINGHLLPNLNFTSAEESQLRDAWFRVALDWTRAVAAELK